MIWVYGEVNNYTLSRTEGNYAPDDFRFFPLGPPATLLNCSGSTFRSWHANSRSVTMGPDLFARFASSCVLSNSIFTSRLGIKNEVHDLQDEKKTYIQQPPPPASSSRRVHFRQTLHSSVQQALVSRWPWLPLPGRSTSNPVGEEVRPGWSDARTMMNKLVRSTMDTMSAYKAVSFPIAHS